MAVEKNLNRQDENSSDSWNYFANTKGNFQEILKR